MGFFSGRASFWGDAYTARKWTTNLRTKIQKCVPTKRNRETNDAFQKVPFHWVSLFAYAVRIASMIFRTGRFLCVICAQICVHALICVQKFGNAYRRNRETNGAFQRHLFTTIKRFSEILKCCSQTMRAFLSQYSRPFRDRLPRVVWCVLRLNPAFCVRCTHHFHDFAYS